MVCILQILRRNKISCRNNDSKFLPSQSLKTFFKKTDAPFTTYESILRQYPKMFLRRIQRLQVLHVLKFVTLICGRLDANVHFLNKSYSLTRPLSSVSGMVNIHTTCSFVVQNFLRRWEGKYEGDGGKLHDANRKDFSSCRRNNTLLRLSEYDQGTSFSSVGRLSRSGDIQADRLSPHFSFEVRDFPDRGLSGNWCDPEGPIAWHLNSFNMTAHKFLVSDSVKKNLMLNIQQILVI